MSVRAAAPATDFCTAQPSEMDLVPRVAADVKIKINPTVFVAKYATDEQINDDIRKTLLQLQSCIIRCAKEDPKLLITPFEGESNHALSRSMIESAIFECFADPSIIAFIDISEPEYHDSHLLYVYKITIRFKIPESSKVGKCDALV